MFGIKSVLYFDKYFKIDPEYKKHPGVFQIDFMTDGDIYSYGFAIKYLTNEIVSEWLIRIETNGEEKSIFERDENSHIESRIQYKDEFDKKRFSVYSEDLQPGELFLNVIGTKNLDKDSELYDIKKAYEWFKKIIIVYPDSHKIDKVGYFLNEQPYTQELAGLLNAFDTGIKDIVKSKQSIEKAFSFLPEKTKNRKLSEIEQSLRDSASGKKSLEVKIKDRQFEITAEDGKILAAKIMTDHGNPHELFELSDESDGTKRLFDLIPLYDLGKAGKIIIIDELDRSFHVKLTTDFVRHFFRTTKDCACQLICTTHDLSLMNLNLLRPDEIWFVERDSDHSSKLYSLNDFKQNFDNTDVMTDYLIGRYGAIPHIVVEDESENRL